MKVALFYYDGFSEFEIVLTALFFKDQGLISVALEDREYRSEESQRFIADKVLSEIDPGSIDLFIIPGGSPDKLVNHLGLKSFIQELIKENKKIAAICGGASLLAGMGLLKGKKCTGMSSGRDSSRPSFQYYSESIFLDDEVVVDGNLITAQGQAYVEFAVELARQMGLCEKEEEYTDALKWFKNIRGD